MFGIMFAEQLPDDYRGWADTDHDLYDASRWDGPWRHARAGLREPWFICEAHAEADLVDRVVTAFEGALGRARCAGAGSAASGWARGDVPPPPRAERKEEGEWPCHWTGTPFARSIGRQPLLLALGESAGEAGVTELARRLGLHKSTASRLLATLQKRGLVEQDDETGKYRLGLVVIRLAERAERTLDLRGIAMPELERLARLTHETTGLAWSTGIRC